MTGDEAELERAFSPLRALLLADGYGLVLARADGHGITLRLSAEPGACADCLVPPAIMEMYARDALKDLAQWRDAPIAFIYPGKPA